MTFINYIENLYQSLDIYRAIIIINTDNNTDNNNDNDLIKELKNKNHEPLLITDEIIEIDYNYRLFIVKNPQNLYKFKKNSYNLIIIY